MIGVRTVICSDGWSRLMVRYFIWTEIVPPRLVSISFSALSVVRIVPVTCFRVSKCPLDVIWTKE